VDVTGRLGFTAATWRHAEQLRPATSTNSSTRQLPEWICEGEELNTPEHTAIIVGASSGIGEALARQLHKAGWKIGLLARRTERLSTIAAELGAHVLTGYADVARDDCADAFHAMAQAIGGVDLVVLSSGCGYLNPDHSPDFDRRTVAVNIIGFIEMARAAFQHFEKRRQGHLAAITSVASLRGNADGASYAATYRSTWTDCVLRHSKKDSPSPSPSYSRDLSTQP